MARKVTSPLASGMAIAVPAVTMLLVVASRRGRAAPVISCNCLIDFASPVMSARRRASKSGGGAGSGRFARRARSRRAPKVKMDPMTSATATARGRAA